MKLALDDFGRGYHNLLLIDLLQPDYLKIDRSITTESTSRVMRWILSLCQDTKTEVIAEGIETREQLDRLLQLGVRYFQGYLFGPPTPLPFLEKHNSLSNKY
ncbi:EAL domain-containing protein [Brevibacillus laterosporus]|uniref:EAL domain-containing protein n=1 Tax=Brevibacillus laterosporus TaxID=1465 RepID=UPI00195C1452|nr:EAL domain-containing protein [Brevibacillus laterosporus]MBM7109718.1 putative cyclic-di-GMP phosphodiesterase AdrB [Brevibacillus laterosporus]